MNRYFVALAVAAAIAIPIGVILLNAQGQGVGSQSSGKMGAPMTAVGDAKPDKEAGSTIFVSEIPAGYRDWKLISVAHEEGGLNDIRAILGNDIAVQALRDGTIPFPDGAIIARLAWDYIPAEENNRIFGVNQSFIAGPPKNGVQFMVRDSKKFPTTGGWGFGQFNEGKPVEAAMLQSCFSCHERIKDRDLVFTRYSP